MEVFLLSAGAILLLCAAAQPSLSQSSSATSATTPAKSATSTHSSAPSAKPPASPKTKTTASHSSSGAHGKSAAPSRKSKTRQAALRKGKRRPRGQQKIDSDRAEEIQLALIREHYLNGSATGTWNQACEDAMRRYQADHGWQSKTVPDSRALISLGLGPSHDHLLNPESAMTSEPTSSLHSPPTTTSIPPTASSLPAAKVPADPAPNAPTTSIDPSRPQ